MRKTKTKTKQKNNHGCSQRGGSPLSPADYSSGGVQYTPGNIPNIHPNTLNNPTDFSSNAAKVAGRGCAGTKLATEAAKGMYKPYGMKGGSNLVRLQKDPLIPNAIVGPKAGYASVGPGELFSKNALQSASSLGAGPVADVGTGALARSFPLTGGKRKKSRKMRKSRHSRKTHRKNRHSRKTHRKGRKGKSHKKSSKRRRSRRVHRGGAPQPYSNTPISFGYSVGAPLPKSKPVYMESALANPPPHHIYDDCTKNNFPPQK